MGSRTYRNDTDNLEIGEERVRRKIVDHFDRSLRGSLRYHDDCLDFDNSGIVGSGGTEEVGCDWSTKIGRSDEGFHDVLGEDKGREVVLDIVVRNVNVLETKRDVGRRNRSNSPIRLTREDLLFVSGSGNNLNLVSLDVGRPGLNCSNLSSSFGRLLDFCHLLSLDRRCSDFHTEDDITDLGRGEGSRVDRVSLGVVGKDEIAKSDFNSHPFLVFESWPNVVRGSDRRLVGSEDDLGLFVVDVNGTKEEDETREGSVG